LRALIEDPKPPRKRSHAIDPIKREPGNQSTRIGDIEIIGLIDGTVKLPPAYFDAVDWQQNADLLDPGKTINLPIGCFLVRAGDLRILVDAGVGPRRLSWAIGGHLVRALARAEVEPEAIDVVVCTHLHLDHIGWLTRQAAPVFPNAMVHFGMPDLAFALDRPSTDPNRRIMETLDRFGCLEPISDEVHEVAAGVTAISTPGHTPGHVSVVVTAGRRQAVLLGDVVITPRQIQHPEWINTTDVDPAQAADTRARLWRRLAGTNTRVTGAHFPGLRFGRVASDDGGYRFIVDGEPQTLQRRAPSS
jgi:glyoxylase-like metal-dependent hydrolase (beta-lactamase superfamily II)